MLALLFTLLALAAPPSFLEWASAPAPIDLATTPRLFDPYPPDRATLPLEAAPDSAYALEQAEPGYRFAAQAFGEIAAQVRDKPGRIVPECIGLTLQGRPIWAFHVRTPEQTATRKVLIFGGIHAMEWISTEVALETLQDLAAHGPPPGVQVTVIPILNPDGRAKVEKDLQAGERIYRRGNARNVDLNRDFAVNRVARAVWRTFIPGYYRTSPGPLSQPETRALDALAAREGYSRAASLHSFGGFFYAPWSGRFHRVPRADRKELWMLGRAMEQAWGTRAYKTRQLGRWGFFFRAHGSEIDHLYGRYGTRAFLIEVTRSGMRPLHPKTWRWGFRVYNPADTRRYRLHRDHTAHSLRALITHPDLPSEVQAAREGRTGLIPPISGDEAP